MTDVYQRLLPAGEEPPGGTKSMLRSGVWDGEIYLTYILFIFLKFLYATVTYFPLIPFQNLSKYTLP